MEPNLKQKLHQLVDNCSDEFILEEAKAVLESNQAGPAFLDELSEEDRDSFLGGEEEHEQGHSITHNRLMHQFGEWNRRSKD